MSRLRAHLVSLLTCFAVGYVLCRFVPDPLVLWHGVSAPHAWIARVGTDRAMSELAGAALWLAAAWLALGLLATTLTARRHRRTSLAALSRWCLPAWLRTAVLTSAGVSLLLGPVEAVADPGPTGGASGPVAGVSAPAWPLDSGSLVTPHAPAGHAMLSTPHWPVDAGEGNTSPSEPPSRNAAPSAGATITTASPATDGVSTTAPSATPSPGQPLSPSATASATPSAGQPLSPSATTSTTPGRGSSGTTAGGTPSPSLSNNPASPAPPTSGPAGPNRSADHRGGPPAVANPRAGDVVTVGPGDSLWMIAARRLGPHASEEQIAVAWPYWYRTNRAVIGADPDTLQPGQRLSEPTGLPR